jgi:hypothetical protein
MSLFRTTLFAALVSGCSTTPTTQVVTGTATDSLAVRAISGDTVVTASAVADDGSFSLALPAGEYRLEVLTSSGAEPVYADNATTLTDLEFTVCHPGAPFDLGAIAPHHVGSGGSGAGSGSGEGSGAGPGSGMCGGHGGMGGHGDCNDPNSCGCAGGSDCWGPPMCGSDACPPPDGGSGMCPDHPPGDFGCGSGD